MSLLVRVILCCVMLVPSVLSGQDEYESTEPHYHWPEYPPFSPGSWAWPTAGFWHFPSFYQNYGTVPRNTQPSYSQPPPTIIVFAPASTPPVYERQKIVTSPTPSPTAAGHSQAPVPPKTPPAESDQQQGSPVYLIALKEGVIRRAISYSVEGKVLHYVDHEGLAKEVPLDRVDLAFSAALNRQRHVPFHLPADE